MSDRDWPDKLEIVQNPGSVGMSWATANVPGQPPVGPHRTRTYIPVQAIRERLLSDEAVEAAAKFEWERQREATEAHATRRQHMNLARWDEAWSGEQDESRAEARALLAATFPEGEEQP